VSRPNLWLFRLYQAFWDGLDLLYPPVCGGCGKTGNRWCPECQHSVPILVEPTCQVCGLPRQTSGTCNVCRERPPSYYLLRSWLAFDDPIREALHRLKYRRDLGLGEALARHMQGFVAGLGWPVELLVPVPLGRRRQKERGYNQVGLVAWPLAMLLGWDYAPKALNRQRETVSQVGLSAEARRKNVWNAFRADSQRLRGRNVLLMDDVATTGATLSACADALLAAGAAKVYALTIARALPHHGLRDV
jgi:ComF family protein